MMFYIHVHRDDRPGGCYWVFKDGMVYDLHHDFAFAEAIHIDDVLRVVHRIGERIKYPLEFSTVTTEQPNEVPSHLRKLLRMG